jgi:hypothetical protein
MTTSKFDQDVVEETARACVVEVESLGKRQRG